jgi:predicted DNA-binding protein
MKNPTHFYLVLFTDASVKIFSPELQLSMIAADTTAWNTGMISAFLVREGIEIEIRGMESIEYFFLVMRSQRCVIHTTSLQRLRWENGGKKIKSGGNNCFRSRTRRH